MLTRTSRSRRPLFIPAATMEIPSDLRDFPLGRKLAVLNISMINLEGLMSLTASRRANWKQGALSVGGTLNVRRPADRGEIAKNPKGDLDLFRCTVLRNFDWARRRNIRARWMWDHSVRRPPSVRHASVPPARPAPSDDEDPPELPQRAIRAISVAGRGEIAPSRDFAHVLCVSIRMGKFPCIGRRRTMWRCARI